MKTQFGRSMIEMLGVLAIIGVISIGGIALYRRAVNNHHANTILDDINRFAFAIIEKGNYPLDSDISKGDFKESGIYELTGHQALSASQFSILVSNVPKGVCESLVDKAHIEYKVGVVAAGGSVDDEVLYDTLHIDLCQDVNDVVFYFGDTSLVCNPKEDGYTPCTINSDCCSGEFCAFQNPSNRYTKGDGICAPIDGFGFETKSVNIKGITTTWLRSTGAYKGKNPTYWTALSWCEAQGRVLANTNSIGCGHISAGKHCTQPPDNQTTDEDLEGTAYKGSILNALQTQDPKWETGYHWITSSSGDSYVVRFPTSYIYFYYKNGGYNILCH